MLTINSPSWFKNAPCVGRDRVFLSSKPSDRNQAKNICSTQCDNVMECRMYAIESNQTIGVWGGLTGPELQREIANDLRRD